MGNVDFNISHAVINTLHAGYQGKFAALNVSAQMGAQLDTAEHARVKDQLDTIGGWGRALWQGTLLLSKPQKSNVSQDGKKALQMLDALKAQFIQTADEIEQTLSQQETPDDVAYLDLAAAFVWYAYARDNYLKGMLAYCEAVKDEAQAQQCRQTLGVCQNEIQMAHEFMAAVAGGIDDRETLWLQLYDATINLPGLFRSQAADIDILRSRYDDKLTYKTVGITESEAIKWSQMGLAADIAVYWKAYGIAPEEAARWMLVKMGDPAYAATWRNRGFEPDQAAEWRAQGFTAKQAAMNRDVGYTNPSTAKSWQQESEKQQIKDQEEQARAEQARAQQAWTNRGFSEEAAAEWKKRGFKEAEIAAQWWDYGFVSEQAQAWRNSGFAPEDANAWRDVGFDKANEANKYREAEIPLEVAAQWKQVGFDIKHYSHFQNVAEALAFIDLGETPAAAVNWKSIDQTPEQVKAWKAAGVNDWGQAKQWIAENIANPEEVSVWIQAGVSLQEAKQWQQAGFSGDAAGTWRKAGFMTPDDAVKWREKGYDDPQQAAVNRRKDPDFVKGFVTRLMFVSKTNPQEVIIYLGTNTDLLNKTFLEAFTQVAKDSMPNGEKERVHFADVFGWIADCLRRLVNGSPAMNAELALGCLLALQDMLKENLPGPAKVQLQFWVAKALISRHKGDKKQNVEKALSLLLNIDKLVNHVMSPRFWAELQQSLGWGLYERQTGDRRKNLMMAIKRYDAALTVFTPGKYPTDHGFTQNMKNQAQEALKDHREHV
jgi:hypothetical protein